MKKPGFLISGLLISGVMMAAAPLKPGDIAADFTLKNVKGEMVTLSEINDAKGFIVVFTSNTCPFARKYEQRIMELNKTFSNKGFPVVAVVSNDPGSSPADSYEGMQKVANEKKYSFQYLRDNNQEVAKQYGATNTPHVFVLSKSGDKLTVEYVGAIDNNVDNPSDADKKYVEDAVNSLLNGERVKITATKAIGCSIKWKES